MSAFFIKWKRIVGYLAGSLAVSFTLFACFYAKRLKNAQTVGVERNFYFLASDCQSLEVSTQIIEFQGGAGYPLLCEKDEYVAYAVYFSENEIKTAQSSVAQIGENAEIVMVTSSPLYLKSTKEKNTTSLILIKKVSSYKEDT